MFNEDEKYRYSRHFILDKVGESGQKKLKNASVLVIGAGGLGCPSLLYLSAAGVGRIGIIDFDKVDKSNLQRQILFTTEDIGKNKAEVAAKRLKRSNPHPHYITYPARLTSKNALEIMQGYDLIIDGSDNFSTRYLVNDACVILNKPFIYGAIFKFEGQLSVFNYKNGPTYRCIFPDPPQAGSVPNCSQIGVIGILPGIIGTQQANEALKIILEIGEISSGKLLMYSALNSHYNEICVERNENAVSSVVENKDSFTERDYRILCGEITEETNDIEEISTEEMKKLLASKHIQILDVREEWEQPSSGNVFDGYSKLIRIPMDALDEQYETIEKSIKTVVICQSGVRSKAAIHKLKNEYNFTNLVNLKGGILAYG